MHVGEVDAVEPQAVELPLDIGPIAFEHSPLLRQPLRRCHLAGSFSQARRREVENERRRNQRQLKYPSLAVLV